MFLLLETVIAFTVVMLTLSYLVKSLTSVVKNHLDYFSRNLKAELERLLKGSVGGGWDDWCKKIPWLGDVRWDRLGEEFLSKENMTRILVMLDAHPAAIQSLEDRLKVHLQNIKYAFETRSKNISLALGVALCLALNINAFAIWSTLYNDQVVRERLADPAKIEALLKATNTEGAISSSGPGKPPQTQAGDNQPAPSSAGKPADNGPALQPTPEQLAEQRDAVFAQIKSLKTDLSFGMGKVWRNDFFKQGASRYETWLAMLFEFLGSLLTGILVSIGAPYWHDLLRKLSSLRSPQGSGKPKTGTA